MKTDTAILKMIIRQMVVRGIDSLSDAQLLALILKKGDAVKDVLTLADGILNRFSLQELTTMPRKHIMEKIRGINEESLASLSACCELYNRINENNASSSFLLTAEDVYKMMRNEMIHYKKEYFRTISVNSKFEVIGIDDISIGSIDSANAHPREVFRNAIAHGAYGIFLVHNHPSNNPTPSSNDHYATERIRESGSIIGIELIDHVIIAAQGYYSFNTGKCVIINADTSEVDKKYLKNVNNVV